MADKNKLVATLKKYFGFDTFKGDQEKIMESLIDEHNTFVLMPTGGGKSLCYQLPSLLMEGTAIVISPLISLMKNQVDAMRNFGEDDGIAHFLNSSLNKQAIDQVKEDILNGKTKLLYVAPESLTKEENLEFFKSAKIQSVPVQISSFRIKQGILDRQPHVGRAQLRDHRSVAEFNHGMNDALRLNDHLYLRQIHIEKPPCFHHLKAFIDHGSGIYGYLLSH